MNRKRDVVFLHEAFDARQCRRRGITGHDVTPVLLEHFHTASGGVSIDTNEELVVANAALAAEIAVALAE